MMQASVTPDSPDRFIQNPGTQVDHTQTLHNSVHTQPQTDDTRTFDLNGHDFNFHFDNHDSSIPPSNSLYYSDK